MKKLLPLAALPIFLFGVAGCGHPAPPPYYAPPPPGVLARQAFDAGVAAANRDMSRGLRPNINRHRNFRNPPVPPGQPAGIYRDNFRRGYQSAYRNGR